jgi:hypothetical protein
MIAEGTLRVLRAVDKRNYCAVQTSALTSEAAPGRLLEFLREHPKSTIEEMSLALELRKGTALAHEPGPSHPWRYANRVLPRHDEKTASEDGSFGNPRVDAQGGGEGEEIL